MNNSEVLYKPFDINIHVNEFIDYLEVIIKKDGTIEYAIPSHQEKLKQVILDDKGFDAYYHHMNDDEALVDFMQWLCDTAECISVWNKFCIKPKNVTTEQMLALTQLKHTYYTHCNRTLYQGDI